ncbi:XdhC/CoxI family protein [Nocardioides immobilis]|uniref:XdhC/CoxI family protein n=1 Tax=Nocardioides immobilis TaxID=2049295 RepID=A0A417XX83_9ACTN|nr:XdhC/CoxI family protein [Nocardioides immobilis]RHW24925.1 XdhC/CoxI family protein [Nocardioides immobilis]
MREILAELVECWSAGEPVALGTVVATFGSAPRQPGASMLVRRSGAVTGSVSGGCVEGAVYERADEVLRGAAPALERYGFSDEDAFAVGLTCGGILDIYVQRISRESFPELAEVAADVAAGRPVAVATVVEHPDPAVLGRHLVVRPRDTSARVVGALGSLRLAEAIATDAQGLLATGQSGTLTYGADGERLGKGARVFVWAAAPPPRMLVFGAIDYASAVAQMGSFLGYDVTVCDARPVFATASRFPAADRVVVSWPHKFLAEEVEAGRVDESTVICVLTHDPKFDGPLLELALRLPSVGYIGAMGSRKTHADRTQRLRAAGLTQAELDRMSSPIGLDLAARTPEETAVSIAAEILARRGGATGLPLRELHSPIHAERPRSIPEESIA